MEFAISLLFFLPVIIGIIDVSIMLTNYQKLEQSVREGVRTASRLSELTQDFNFQNTDTEANINTCRSVSRPAPSQLLDCGHVLVHSRIRAVLRHENLINFKVVADPNTPGQEVAITSTFCPRGITTPVICPNTTQDQDTIIVVASGRYNGLFGNWPLNATYQGPWLFQNVATN